MFIWNQWKLPSSPCVWDDGTPVWDDGTPVWDVQVTVWVSMRRILRWGV